MLQIKKSFIIALIFIPIWDIFDNEELAILVLTELGNLNMNKFLLCFLTSGKLK